MDFVKFKWNTALRSYTDSVSKMEERFYTSSIKF